MVVGQFISSPCQGAAFTVGSALPIAAAVLLIFYPAWDAAANVLDAQRNGGLKRNPTQAVNALLSLVATLAIALALSNSMARCLSRPPFSPELERFMAKRMNAHTIELPASHVSLLSHPREIAELIEQAARGAD